MMGQRGGSTVLTEVPEMFGAEGFLMDRCINKEVFVKAEHMINGFKEYFISHNDVVYDNPSPGNKQGGITTLEDKSCGCVQKGGTAPIMDVIGYGDPVVTKGLNMLYGPGNDLVSATAMTAAGAHLILFSTGQRGVGRDLQGGSRGINKEVFVKAEHMINGFKDYFISHNEVVYDNPSPGNKQGGITTLVEKRIR